LVDPRTAPRNAAQCPLLALPAIRHHLDRGTGTEPLSSHTSGVIFSDVNNWNRPESEDATGRTAVEIVYNSVVAPPVETVLSDISLNLRQYILAP